MKKTLLKIYISAVFLCHMPVYPLFAQVSGIRLEEVLLPGAPPLATIDCIYEDSRGFIWLGCYSGLYQFDGYEVQSFYYKPEEQQTISDNKITKILEDKSGDLWIGMQQGLNCFNVRKKIFYRYTDLKQYGIGEVEVSDLRQSENGDLWVATQDGLYVKAYSENRFVKIFPTSSNTSTAVLGIELIQNSVYFCTPSGLLFYDFHTRQISTIAAAATIFSGAQKERVSLIKDHNNRIWLGTSRGLFTRSHLLEKGFSQIDKLAGEAVYCISRENAQGELWVSTTTGLSIIQTESQRCIKNISQQKNGTVIIPEVFSQIYPSTSGIVWMSSLTRHLYQADSRKLCYHQIHINLLEHLDGAARKLFELYEFSPGQLLIPGSNGPELLHIQTGNSTQFPFKPFYNLKGWKEGLTCFLDEAPGLLWMGTAGGIFLFDKRLNKFVDLEKKWPCFSLLRSISVRKIHRDRKNRFWVATWYKGIFQIDLTTGVCRQYNNTEQHEVQKSAFTRSILEAYDGTLWFGTRGGLLRYWEEGDSFQVFRKNERVPGSMSENTAFCIYEDIEGQIWCGTYGGGINRLNPQTGHFKHLTTSNGLLNNNAFCLMPDSRKRLWIMGYNGISRFDPATDSFYVITRRQGLLNDEFDAFLYGKSPYSGYLFFGGKSGIDFFHPDSIQPSHYKPRVWIKDFKLFNQSVPIDNSSKNYLLAEDISFTKHITLEHDQNVLTFDYVALDFSSPGSIQYAYMLEGFDQEWQYVGAKRSVTFTNLDEGKYTFRVKATNSDGIWISEEASIQIYVKAPWWQTGWFLTIALLAFAGLTMAVYRYRIHQMTLRARLNQRISEVKMEALRAQMNPHFIFNCLSSLKSYVEQNETVKASTHLSKFARLLRDVLDYAKFEVIPLEKEIEIVRRYVELEQMRYKNFEFRIETDPSLLLRTIAIPPLLLQPYIENAIWHGLQRKTTGGGLLLLTVSKLGTDCQIEITDNGIGRTAARMHRVNSLRTHHSHGLNITAERIQLFNSRSGYKASVEITDMVAAQGLAAGTRIVLCFPTNTCVWDHFSFNTPHHDLYFDR